MAQPEASRRWIAAASAVAPTAARGTTTDRFNALPIRQAIVVPLTTRERGFPHHIAVTDDGGVNRPSGVAGALRAAYRHR